MVLIWLRSIPAAFMLAGRLVALACHWPTPDPAVDHDVFVADLEHDDGQRDRHEFGGQARLGERLLGVLDRGILDEGRIVRLAPDPVIDGGHLDRADLVFVDAVGRLERSFGVGGTDESELLAVQAECRGDRSGSQDTPARHDKH